MANEEMAKMVEFLSVPLRDAKPLLVPEGFRPFAECSDEDDELIMWFYQEKAA